MKQTRVVVLGASGMLGHMVVRTLAGHDDLQVAGTLRPGVGRDASGVPPAVATIPLDVEATDDSELARAIDGAAWVVNAVGLIKPHIQEFSAADQERAIRVNALFPHALARAAAACGASVLQIATDCVYSGAAGGYLESSPHDALDVYGKTKSLGEVRAAHVHHLRCSIVGPEHGRRSSLLEWFRQQPRGARLKGYTTHRWNGITTVHFARLCAAVVRQRVALSHLLHVVPADAVTKHELLEIFRAAFDRRDVAIEPQEVTPAVDRTIATSDERRVSSLWAAAGYGQAPTIAQMVEELASGAVEQPALRQAAS